MPGPGGEGRAGLGGCCARRVHQEGASGGVERPRAAAVAVAVRGCRGCGAAAEGQQLPLPSASCATAAARSHRDTWGRNSHRSRSCRVIPGPRNSSLHCAVLASAGFKTPVLHKAIHRTGSDPTQVKSDP